MKKHGLVSRRARKTQTAARESVATKGLVSNARAQMIVLVIRKSPDVSRERAGAKTRVIVQSLCRFVRPKSAAFNAQRTPIVRQDFPAASEENVKHALAITIANASLSATTNA